MNGRDLGYWSRVAARDLPGAGGHRVVAELVRCGRRFTKITPSVEGIAQRAGCSPATVKRTTAALRAAGYLRVVTRRAHCRGDGTWHRSQTNLYIPVITPRAPHRPCVHRGITRDPSIGASPGSSTPAGAAVVDNPPTPPPPDPPPLVDRTRAGAIWRQAAADERAARLRGDR